MVLIPSLDGPHRRLQAQVRHVLDQIWTVLLANLGCAVIYVMAVWNSVDRTRLLIWMSAFFLMVLIRAIYHIGIRRRGDAYIDTHAESIMRVLYVTILISAAIWGMIGSALLHSPDTFAIMVSTFIIAGLSGGGVASYAVSSRLLYPFLFLIVGPLILRLSFETDGEYKLLSALAGFYLILLSVSARNVSRYNRESIDMTLANEDLIQKFNDASHEVRTPVSAITGFAEALMERQDLSAVDKNFVSVIYRNSVYLGRLVDNLFLMAKAEAGELATREETFNLKENVQLAVELVRNKVVQKGLRLAVNFQMEMPPYVKTCPIKLQQILINLLSNAVKFTDRGEIRLSVERMADDRLRVEVADTGIGVREEGRDLVFAPFWRENRKEVKKEEGSGLGLALSRHLVVLMGGELRLVSSRVGEGSVFEFTLPVEWSNSVEGLAPVSSRVSRLNGKKILFADDSADLRSLYNYRFSQVGAVVEAAEDGNKAVEMARTSAGLDLIILDIHMPGLDGYQAAAEMRKSGVKVPILALTANESSKMEQEKCHRAGFSGIAPKSIPVSKIVDMVADYV